MHFFVSRVMCSRLYTSLSVVTLHSVLYDGLLITSGVVVARHALARVRQPQTSLH